MNEPRKTELNALLEKKITMSEFHKEVERIMQRPVYTHEMASSVWGYLLDELDGKPVPSAMEKICQMRKGEHIIVLEVEK